MGKWSDNSIQFPRLIAEIEAAGGFTPHLMKDLSESMDLSIDDICDIIDRAQTSWERIKTKG